MTSKARKRSHTNATTPAPRAPSPSNQGRKRALALNRTLAPVGQALASASFIGGAALIYDPKGSGIEGGLLLLSGMVFFLLSYRAHLKGDF